MAEALPLVGVSFEAGRGLEQVLAWVGRTLTNKVLVQVPTNLLSIKPVLEGLQALPTVPLAEELVYSQAPQRPSYLSAAQVEAAVAQQQQALQLDGMALDPSQAAALEHGLSQRVALIQGPPGTGKTFIGAMLCEAIVRHSQETILCVCYTNHVLDQFLEAQHRPTLATLPRGPEPTITKHCNIDHCSLVQGSLVIFAIKVGEGKHRHPARPS